MNSINTDNYDGSLMGWIRKLQGRKEKLSDDEVVAMGNKVQDKITELFKIALREIDKNV